MRISKLSALFLTGTLLLAGCNQLPQNETSENNPAIYDGVSGDQGYAEDERWARENLDLEAVGTILERADSAEEFEYLLNDPNEGINNLDLNGDGYADYISVREFGEGDQRGFSLFDRFGPELIQEIATIFFDRDGGYDYPGARVLMRGNEQIYGDDYYYETNWLDRAIPIVSYLFTDRNDDNYYVSPYYYENYPTYYEPYEIVETPIYRQRIEQYYATPVFAQTAQPTVTNIKIISPNAGRTMNKIYSRLAKPTREQVDFVRTNPKPVKSERVRNEKFRNAPGKPDKTFKENKPFKETERAERRAKFESERREKPNKQKRNDFQPQQQSRVERAKQQKFERPNQPRVERQNQPKFERPPKMKPPKQENRPQKGGGNPNRGGGNNKGGGKGKGKP